MARLEGGRLPGRAATKKRLAPALVLAALVVPAAARADVAACVAASEDGQRARAAGKLRRAREHFLVCGVKSCPSLVRTDCATWTAELSAAVPTVVFGARDTNDKDLFDVRVTLDSEVLTERLDGKAVPIDPGRRTFRFEAAGFAPRSITALVKEGERARAIDARLEPLHPASPAPEPPAPSPAPPPSDVPRPVPSEHTVLPWIVVALGGAAVAGGIVVLATTPDRPENCDASSRTCTRLSGQSERDYRAQQDLAGRADVQPVLGLVIAGAGVVVAAAGLLWHFLEPTSRAPAPPGTSRRAPLADPFRVTF
jgi:hypothetical protein